MKNFASALLVTVLVTASPLLAQQSIVGTWENQGNGTEMIFSFSNDGTGTWSVVVSGDQGFSDLYEFNYVVDYERTPYHLDIMDIDHGFLSDKTMYGVFRLENDETLVLDFEPGPREDGSSVRPEDFTSDAVTLTKVP